MILSWVFFMQVSPCKRRYAVCLHHSSDLIGETALATYPMPKYPMISWLPFDPPLSKILEGSSVTVHQSTAPWRPLALLCETQVVGNLQLLTSCLSVKDSCTIGSRNFGTMLRSILSISPGRLWLEVPETALTLEFRCICLTGDWPFHH